MSKIQEDVSVSKNLIAGLENVYTMFDIRHWFLGTSQEIEVVLGNPERLAVRTFHKDPGIMPRSDLKRGPFKHFIFECGWCVDIGLCVHIGCAEENGKRIVACLHAQKEKNGNKDIENTQIYHEDLEEPSATLVFSNEE